MNSQKSKSARINNLNQVMEHIDTPLLGEELKPLIKDSLAKCNKDTYRKGTKLIPEFLVFFVIAITLRRDLSYPAVLDWLLCKMRWITCSLPKKLISDGAISHARQCLGIEVFSEIFKNLAPKDKELPRDFYGMTSVAFDGTNLTMPDSKQNEEEFGTPSGGRGKGGFPQLRSVALLVLSLGTIIDFDYAMYRGKGTGERSMMNKILNRTTYTGLLLLLDAGLYSFDLFLFCQNNKIKSLTKLSNTVKPVKIPGQNFPDGSYLAFITKKIKDPERKNQFITIKITVRIIEYQIPGFRAARLITNILDSKISARVLALHYHKRWDIELAFDEIKTHQCATLKGQSPTILRSKNPELVKQELHAIYIAYNIVRKLIQQASEDTTKNVREMSFLDSLQCIIDAIPNMISADNNLCHKQYLYLIDMLSECEIDRPKRNRINPRVVKIKMSKYKRKRSSDKSSKRNLEEELQVIGELAA